MGSRLAVLIAVGALALASALPAPAAEKAPISYPNQPAIKSPAKPAVIEGQRNILQMVAEQLNLSDGQKLRAKKREISPDQAADKGQLCGRSNA
jgi:hypothetical protein